MTPDRTGQVWRDLDLGIPVVIWVYGPPVRTVYGGYLHPVVVLDQGREVLWGSGNWESDSCMSRVL